MLNIGICDDNKNILNSFVRYLEDICFEIDLDISSITSTSEQNLIYNKIKEFKIDILFLDIDFGKNSENGITFAKSLRKLNRSFKLVFVTGHFEYSLLAFKCKTFDYLLKPVSKDKLKQVLLNLKEEIIQNNNLNFIKLNRNLVLKADDILFIEKNKSNACIHTKDNIYISSLSLNNILEKLPKYFFRTSRSFVVNKNKIISIDKKNKIFNFENNKVCPMIQYNF